MSELKNIEYDRYEFDSLRNEILSSDNTCMAIITSLLSLTIIFYTYILTKPFDFVVLTFLISILWYLGFNYITDKRFVIFRIAGYFREKFGSLRDPRMLIWEDWQKKHFKDYPLLKILRRKELIDTNKYPRIFPYFIEGFIVLVVMSINFGLGLLSCLSCYNTIFHICKPITDNNILYISIAVLNCIIFLITFNRFIFFRRFIKAILR